MPPLKLGSTVIVSDSLGNEHYGQIGFSGGALAREIHQRSMPPADGVYEVDAGKRERYVRVDCLWFSNNPFSLEQTIDDLHASNRYQTLTIEPGVGANLVYNYCRLFDWEPADMAITGDQDGSGVMVVSKTLIFIQTRHS